MASSKVLLPHLLVFLAICIAPHLSAQDNNTKYSSTDDTSSLDSILSTLYAVISGEKGEQRDWDQFLNLFNENALLIPSGKNKEGEMVIRHMTPKEYVEQSGPYLVKNGFFENEVSRKEEHFSSLTHVWSTYESRHSKSDEKPFARGINSIQLMNDGNRWWIVNIYWTAETDNNPIPAKYLN